MSLWKEFSIGKHKEWGYSLRQTIKDIRRNWILWEDPYEDVVEVKYSRSEWKVLRESILEKAGLPSTGIKLGDLRGITFEMNEDFTEALVWVGLKEPPIEGIDICLHEPQEFDQLEPSKRKSLVAGDFAFTTRYRRKVLVERKTWHDLLTGLSVFGKTKTKSPRDINDQMTKLLDGSDFAFFILERHPRVRLKDGIMLSNLKEKPPWHKKSTAYVDGWLLPWQLAGVILLETNGIEDSIRTIQWLYNYFQHDDHSVVYRAPRQIVIDKGTYKGLNLLLGIEGMGEVLSRRALNYWGTARKFFQAGYSDRAFHIDGMGVILTKAVDEALDEEYIPPKRIAL